MAGYYNPKKDYAAAIKNEKNPAKKEQLKAERQNKIDAMNAAVAVCVCVVAVGCIAALFVLFSAASVLRYCPCGALACGIPP